MRTHRCYHGSLLFVLSIFAVSMSWQLLQGQTAGTPQSIEQKISAQYTPTKATADHSDIVTAGAVIVLKKDGLIMTSTTSGAAAANVYKDGHITSSGAWKMARGLAALRNRSGQGGGDTRTFVTGEKFWLTKVDVRDDGVVLELMSDPISDIRYYSSLKLPFPKGAYPPDDEALKSVSEVLDVAPADNSGGQQTAAGGQDSAPAQGGAPAAAPAAPPEPAPAPMAAIPPPPPPTDTPPPAPKTIALKQTKEQVLATFGPPTKVVKLGTKEIDYYPDMKVTFVNDKVTDVQ